MSLNVVERLKRFCFGILLSVVILGPVGSMSAVSARAADEPPMHESPGEMAREGMDRMLEALNRLIQMIPQYDLPEMLDNGDIIIRRRNPDSGQDQGQEETPPDVVETNT